MNDSVYLITECNDQSTYKEIDWLLFYKQPYIRKNVENDFQEFQISLIDGKVESSFYNSVLWNRRGYLPILPNILKLTTWGSYLKKEQLPVLFTLESINKSNYIGSYKQEFNNNKILNLLEASKVGLEVPKTIVTNNRKNLLQFVEKGKGYITKSIYQTPYLETADFYCYGEGTFELNFDEVSEIFAPSLVQEYIEKEIEIRTFFIEENYYSIAIFSQNDEKTKIDFRNYNQSKPNRNVPFILPDNILNKLKLFSKKMNYKTGSFDLILTPKGKYFFLEINPMGQYDWVSQDCNYYIDKKIAELLIEKSKYEKRN